MSTTSRGIGLHPLYSCWSHMIERCENKKHKSYANYGGRGIKVCFRWRASFHNFLRDMSERPAGMTLDRIDNNKNYTPKNCRWATLKEQKTNRRVSKIVFLDGRQMQAIDAAKEIGVTRQALFYRARNRGGSYQAAVDSYREEQR